MLCNLQLRPKIPCLLTGKQRNIVRKCLHGTKLRYSPIVIYVYLRSNFQLHSTEGLNGVVAFTVNG